MAIFDWFHDPFGQEGLNDKGKPRQCELFGKFGIALQIILGILCFSSLLCKRSIEHPKRSYKIFLLDISKQGLSAGWMHVLNVLLAVYLELKVNKGNGCQWYFINIVCENFISVSLAIMIHSTVINFANKHDILVLQSGVYLSIHDAQYIYRYSYEDLDKHINYKVWFIQLMIWLMITTIAKLVTFGLEYQWAEELIDMGIYSLQFFEPYPNIELFLVMMVAPFTLNTIQYWVQDNFLKGTDFIESQKRQSSKNRKEARELHILQDGMIDFKKNRASYRAEVGLREEDLNSSELESNLNQKEVEDEFMLVEDKSRTPNKRRNKSKVDGEQDPGQIRRSHIVRQIEEGVLGVRDDDYDEHGQLDLNKIEERQRSSNKK